ncbi:MAG TPA: SWIM zinc finger family protein [Aggregatilineales bacterium]|nr:SWIM zinc finger family protein [Aggregatilineales bacterium]
MDYGMIGKIEKARRYAQERDRIRFEQFTVTVAGENDSHAVYFDRGTWQCDCNFFQSRGVCSHTMAMERVLEGMIPEPASS